MRETAILERDLTRALEEIRPADEERMAQARRHWDAVAKPLHGLGLLEDVVVRMAGVAPLGRDLKKAVAAFCADNGVVAQGVTQTDSSVTAVVAGNMLTGKASVCCMSRVAGAKVFPVDAGMVTEVEGLRSIKVRRGTRDLSQEPAMTRQECLSVLLAGMDIARELSEMGCGLLAAGEMGIGNTTTSAAVACALLDRPAEDFTGRGAGLSDAGLARKVAAVRKALALNRPDPADPLDVLAKVGGFDLAGLCGVFLGGAACRVPVLADGLISTVAALCAVRLCPGAAKAVFASHVSAEPAGRAVLDALGKQPLITAGMRLGEGTGAVASIPLWDMARAVYAESYSFAQCGVEAYQPQGG